MKQNKRLLKFVRATKEKVRSIKIMKDKTLETEESTKKKASKIAGAVKERFGSTL
jgi:hypothetical protein